MEGIKWTFNYLGSYQCLREVPEHYKMFFLGVRYSIRLHEHKFMESKISPFKSEGNFLLVERPYATYVIVLSPAFLTFRMGIIIPFLTGPHKD